MTRQLFVLGKKLDFFGWVKSARKQKKFTFLDVHDGSQGIQAVVATEELPSVKSVSHHSAIKVSGEIVKSDHPKQELEMRVQDFSVINATDLTKYPIGARKKYPEKFLRQYPMFQAKTNTFRSLLRVRNSLTRSIHEFFQERNFLEIHTPIITSNDCEGAGEVFSILPANPKIIETMKKSEDSSLEETYFDKSVYLTVSGQLHLEAICNGISRVYTFSPAFRAEMGRTRRHLAEFSMVEAEEAFIFDIKELTDFMESLCKISVSKLLEKSSEDVGVFFSKEDNKANSEELVNKMLSSNFVTLSYTEAISILDKHRSKFDVSPEFGRSLGKEHELFLTEYSGNIPVFVVEWPEETAPFYARKSLEDESKVLSVDLLFPIVGEGIGGSLREHRYEVLKERIVKAGITLDSLQWYLDMREFGGCAPTGGFGLGFERFIQFILGIPNIQDTLPFPRTPHNCRL